MASERDYDYKSMRAKKSKGRKAAPGARQIFLNGPLLSLRRELHVHARPRDRDQTQSISDCMNLKAPNDENYLGLRILVANKLDITRHFVPLANLETLVQAQHAVFEMPANVFDPLPVSLRRRASPNVDPVERFARRDDDARDFVGEGFRVRGRVCRGRS